MKISKPVKITLIVLGVLLVISAIVVPTTLYFTVWKNETKNTDPELAKHHLTYSVTVNNMMHLEASEANKIKSEIAKKIANELSFLKEGVDYEIIGLQAIQENGGLKAIKENETIEIKALPTSEKATGSFKLQWVIKENITGRSVTVPVSESDVTNGFTDESARFAKGMVPGRVQGSLSEGQNNELGIDYDIIGLDSIVTGAKPGDVSKIVHVVGKSAHLTGKFYVQFIVGG